MTAEIVQSFKIDRRQVNYITPSSRVSELVQMPLHLIDGEALSNAYMRDFFNERRKALEEMWE